MTELGEGLSLPFSKMKGGASVTIHLKELREVKELTKVQVWKGADISSSQYDNLESGRSLPIISTAYKIAKVLEVTVQEIWEE